MATSAWSGAPSCTVRGSSKSLIKYASQRVAYIMFYAWLVRSMQSQQFWSCCPHSPGLFALSNGCARRSSMQCETHHCCLPSIDEVMPATSMAPVSSVASSTQSSQPPSPVSPASNSMPSWMAEVLSVAWTGRSKIACCSLREESRNKSKSQQQMYNKNQCTL